MKLEIIVRAYDSDNKVIHEAQPCTLASGLAVSREVRRKFSSAARVEIEEGPDWPKYSLVK